MRALHPSFLFCALAAVVSLPSHACDPVTGAREQVVMLSSGGERLKSWTVKDSEVQTVVLKNGFRLGIRVEPSTLHKYVEASREQRYMPELVKITLFDATSAELKELTHTWGGANSLQGYGPHGGADRVVAVGEPGITLFLNNAVCVATSGPSTARKGG
jgi:hypothetical protein